LIALLLNIHLAKTAYNVGSSTSDSVFNVNLVAFKTFAGIDSISQSQSLCLLSTLFDWDNTWIVDTGASDHMYNNKNLFISLKTLKKTSSVVLPNGKCVFVTHTGSVLINSGLVLHAVLYILSFKYNLLSVSKLSSQQN